MKNISTNSNSASATRLFLFVCLITLPIQAQQQKITSDSLKSTDTTLQKKVSDSLQIKTVADSANSQKDSVLSKSPSVKSDSNVIHGKDTTKQDSVHIENGLYFGAGIGWDIGNFEVAQLWEGALPDSLAKYGISKYMFRADTSIKDLTYSDTAELKFIVKEQPEQYNIMFPISLSLSKVSDKRRLGIATSFSFISKMQKVVITGITDSLSEPVNIKNRLRSFTVSISGNYAFPIPAHYFTIESVDRSYIILGIGLAPQFIQSSGSVEYNGKNQRLQLIKSAADSTLTKKHAAGLGITARVGVSTLRHLNSTSMVEFGVFYSLSRFDFFYADGKRINKEWLNPHVKDYNKPLSYLSNRFELSVSLLRRKTK